MAELKLYDWARVTGEVAGDAQFRSKVEDFQVTENLRFEPSGEGAHHLLFIEKRNVNTDIVCQKLRRFAQVKPLDIGYAGKKDRFAVAKQWFSVQLPILQEVDWASFNDDEVTVLESIRHGKKLRVGAVKSNQFVITLRNFEGDKKQFERKLSEIEQTGFPNYFGEQRFGHNGDNLNRGLDLLKSKKRLKNRNLQGILFSSVRSAIFNHLLSQRITAGQFSNLLQGDYVQLDGSESGFIVKDLGQELPRYNANDIHPCATLVGRGREINADDAYQFEQESLSDYQDIIDNLAAKGLSMASRSIRVFPQNLKLDWKNPKTLVLSFELPKGSFATSFLRELVNLNVETNSLKINIANNKVETEKDVGITINEHIIK